MLAPKCDHPRIAALGEFAAYPNLFYQDQLFGNNCLFLEERTYGRISFLTNRGSCFNDLTDSDPFDLPTTLLKSEQPAEFSEETRSDQAEQIVVPLSEEKLEISKRTVAISVVRLDKHVQSFDVKLDEPLAIVSSARHGRPQTEAP